jgi:hypothetical protein
VAQVKSLGPVLQILCKRKPPRSQRLKLSSWVKYAVGWNQPPGVANSPSSSVLCSTSPTTQPSSGIASMRAPSVQMCRPGTSTTGNGGVPVSIPSSSNSELFIIFGVEGGRRTLEIAHLNTLKLKDDSEFFKHLCREYRRLRGYLRRWFSIWQLRYCDFVKVRTTPTRTPYLAEIILYSLKK